MLGDDGNLMPADGNSFPVFIHFGMDDWGNWRLKFAESLTNAFEPVGINIHQLVRF